MTRLAQQQLCVPGAKHDKPSLGPAVTRLRGTEKATYRQALLCPKIITLIRILDNMVSCFYFLVKTSSTTCLLKLLKYFLFELESKFFTLIS